MAKSHRKKLRWITGTVLVLLTWILLGQFVLFKNRISDQDSLALFQRKGTGLRIRDTLVNGHRIHFATSGRDTLPTIVFIHGSPGSWSNYRACMWDPELRKRYRFVSFDRPGFGYSDFGEVLPLKQQAGLLLPVIRGLDNGRTVTVFGHSMGAPVAAQIAAMDTSLVDRLVLSGAPLDVRLEEKETWRQVMDAGPMKFLLPGSFRPSNQELLLLKKDLTGFGNELEKIRASVYFHHGDEDNWVPIGNIQFGIDHLTNAANLKSDTVRGAGHLIPWQNQKEFLDYLRSIP